MKFKKGHIYTGLKLTNHHYIYSIESKL